MKEVRGLLHAESENWLLVRTSPVQEVDWYPLLALPSLETGTHSEFVSELVLIGVFSMQSWDKP